MWQRVEEWQNGKFSNGSRFSLFPQAYAFQFDIVLSWPNLPNISEKTLTLNLWRRKRTVGERRQFSQTGLGTPPPARVKTFLKKWNLIKAQQFRERKEEGKRSSLDVLEYLNLESCATNKVPGAKHGIVLEVLTLQ